MITSIKSYFRKFKIWRNLVILNAKEKKDTPIESTNPNVYEALGLDLKNPNFKEVSPEVYETLGLNPENPDLSSTSVEDVKEVLKKLKKGKTAEKTSTIGDVGSGLPIPSDEIFTSDIPKEVTSSETPSPIQAEEVSSLLTSKTASISSETGFGKESSSKTTRKRPNTPTITSTGTVNLSEEESLDQSLVRAGLKVASKGRYISIIKRFLNNNYLSDKERTILKSLPLVFFNLISDQISSESRVKSFLEKTDSVIKVTYFLKHKKIKILKQKTIKDSQEVESLAIVPTKILNPETFKVSLYFVVLENDFKLTWEELVEYLKNKIFTDFFAQLIPTDCYLESIELKIEFPVLLENFVKTFPVMEFGELDSKTNVSTTKMFAFNLSNTNLPSSRNQYQIKLPFISSSFLEGEVSPTNPMLIKAQNFADFLSKPIGISVAQSGGVGNTPKANLVLQLVLKTSRTEVVRPYWLVDTIIPMGFINSRSTVKNLDLLFDGEVI